MLKINRGQLHASVSKVYESLLPLSFNLTGLVAGVFVATFSGVIATVPWGFLIYPGILSIRGALGGLFAGRLSTALHLGTVKPQLRDNTVHLSILVKSIVALTLLSGVFIGLTGSVFSGLYTGFSAVESLKIIAVTIATMAVSNVVISPITFGLSIVSFNRGYDPDVVLYPIVSTVADIMITITYIAMVWLSLSQTGLIMITAVATGFTAWSALVIRENMAEDEFSQTIREFLITLVIVSVIVGITGTTLERISERIQGAREIYAIYPALIDTIGDVGSIIGCTLTTKLALGTVPSHPRRLSDLKGELGEVVSAWGASVILFGMYALIASLIYAPAGLAALTLRLLALNLISVPIIILVVFVITYATYSRGWNPDNFLIPIESSLADTVTTLALLLVLLLG
ncbi:hypothetical protein A3K69_05885 [Candidatus Bathyarchaeota archaeon RBG_16_57_9]|nr:MAG: hypothetical protein A3K69_05885 [Candidatus Bathyarchaeota archaeon RBG_16_57_9]OGD53964.1 MAG: hypothetical protein A3K81_00435 [Candidatus Bathyarchaeota archaeon RBG_13_60_20]